VKQLKNDKIKLILLKEIFAVAQLEKGGSFPNWAITSELWSITATQDEISIVCRQDIVPAQVKSEKDWRCLKVDAVLDFSLVGILASLTLPLAQEGISIFAMSTFNTDYLLIKEIDVDKTIMVLLNQGFEILKND
jgi:hypothetical protein